MSVNEKMTAIADAIRNKTGKTEKLNLDDMATGVGEVYNAGFEAGQKSGGGDTEAAYNEGFEAGKQAGEDAMWDIIQANGTRTDYTTAFNDWTTAKVLNTKYPVNTLTLYETFRWCENLEHLPVVISSNADGKYNSCYCAFYDCRKLKSIDFDIYNKASGSLAWGYAFAGCYELVRIQKLGIVANQGFTNTFNNCCSLTEIRFDGEIGQSGLDLHWSTKLSKESIISIIDALSDTTSGLSITLSMAAVDSAFYDPDGEDVIGSTSSAWAWLLDTKPNWTISLV